MKTMNNVPEKHVFVCVNERTDGRDCCADVHGMDIFMELKKFVISHGLVGRIWVTKTGCLGFCNPVGTTIVVYPDQKWFLEVTMKDLEHIKKLFWQ
ncbi:MAG TPA: (2Fe-2S) ferredoxin domain-containing protein [Candidatus Nanoarchaeia archaeon]|nr:(2Fe-2S) ferredoxin domain-containing protein [Candidatus Nanoarchaeia archaeon]